MTEALVDIDQLAQLMNRTTDSVYQARKRAPETVPPNSFKIGRKVYWRSSTVEAWFQFLETEQNGHPSGLPESDGAAVVIPDMTKRREVADVS
jgi:predicted DNA-binding transcriptional regulator AlpA